MNNLNILKNKKVLYVEDDEVVRESTTLVLKLFFKDIIIAIDGEEATKISDKMLFDIVILDLKLPKVNGLEIAKKIRKRNQNCLILMISSYIEIEYLREALKIGMIDYLPKPFEFIELKKIFEECAKRFERKEYIVLDKNLKYDYYLKIVLNEDKVITLTKNEVIFLELLIKNKNQVVSYEMISKELFNSANITNNIPSIKNLLLRLRKKLDIKLVENVFEMGYRVL